MNIRKLQESDLDDILSLQTDLGFQNWSRNSWLNETQADSFSFVALNPELLGFLVLRSMGQEAELLSIAVQKNHQGLGIAINLLETGIMALKAQGCTQIFLEVRKSNLRAVQFYKKQGFLFANTRKNYYDDKEDALIFVLNL
jgi:ribosomal-protein-alanine N-acetyltransferase